MRLGPGRVDALLSAAGSEDARVVALASPNDPTGELLASGELERLLAASRRESAVLLDEALILVSDAQPLDTSLKVLETSPRLLVFRSFLKAWVSAGVRYRLRRDRRTGLGGLLAELEPDLGVSEVSQSGALEALRSGTDSLARHVQSVREERARL